MPHLQWGLLLTLLFQWWQWLDWVQAFSQAYICGIIAWGNWGQSVAWDRRSLAFLSWKESRKILDLQLENPVLGFINLLPGQPCATLKCSQSHQRDELYKKIFLIANLVKLYTLDLKYFWENYSWRKWKIDHKNLPIQAVFVVLIMVKIRLCWLGIMAEKTDICTSGWAVFYFCGIASINLRTWKSSNQALGYSEFS